MPDRKVSPPIKDAIDYHISLKKPEIFKLDNGVTVYNIHAGTERVVQLEWVFKAGNWYEKKNNVAAAANFLLKNGTTKHNAYEINEFVDFYGAYLNRTCYNETASITLHCLSHHLEQLLPMVREILTDAVLPDQELQIFKQNMKQKLSVNLRKCDFVAGRKIDALLFGEKHPYGIYSELADYDALKREELLEHYNHYYRNGYCTVFSAGILPDNYAVLMNQYFGDLPLNTRLLEEVEHAS